MGMAQGNAPMRAALGSLKGADITYLPSALDFGSANLALLGGGVLAAPLGAWVAKHVPPRTAIIAVGLVVTGLSVHGLIRWAMA